MVRSSNKSERGPHGLRWTAAPILVRRQKLYEPKDARVEGLREGLTLSLISVAAQKPHPDATLKGQLITGWRSRWIKSLTDTEALE